MLIGAAKETEAGEARVALTPEVAKKCIKKGFTVMVESGAGIAAGFKDDSYQAVGVRVGARSELLSQIDILWSIHTPVESVLGELKPGALIFSFLGPSGQSFFDAVGKGQLSLLALEKIPRISRAQSMDVLSSQANIAGYRAVLEAATHYGRFFPLMMTSAGSAKAAKVMILGVGVAGLQAISTAKRLGAVVEAYDVRPEVREQILSLGAKPVDLDVGESGSGSGGYAKELSQEARLKQQEALTKKIQACDIVITTASIPGKKAPILVTEAAVAGMRPGSVVIDMAAGSGGNCPLTKPNETILYEGVKIVGWTNYPSKVASDASQFFANNCLALLQLLLDEKGVWIDAGLSTDPIIQASLVLYQGKRKGD